MAKDIPIEKLDIVSDVEQYQKDSEMYIKNIAKYMAKKIADDLTEEAHSAIREFYTSYHPKDYVRHYNFWDSYKRICRKRNGVYRTGVELCVNKLPNEYNMKEKTRKISNDPSYSISWIDNKPEDVFWRVYDFGWHGIASKIYDTVPIMSPTPHERIKDKYDYISKHLDDYEAEASKMAAKGKYAKLFQG